MLDPPIRWPPRRINHGQGLVAFEHVSWDRAQRFAEWPFDTVKRVGREFPVGDATKTAGPSLADELERFQKLSDALSITLGIPSHRRRGEQSVAVQDVGEGAVEFPMQFAVLFLQDQVGVDGVLLPQCSDEDNLAGIDWLDERRAGVEQAVSRLDWNRRVGSLDILHLIEQQGTEQTVERHVPATSDERRVEMSSDLDLVQSLPRSLRPDRSVSSGSSLWEPRE